MDVRRSVTQEMVFSLGEDVSKNLSAQLLFLPAQLSCDHAAFER
jgi:hypothetical protein